MLRRERRRRTRVGIDDMLELHTR